MNIKVLDHVWTGVERLLEGRNGSYQLAWVDEDTDEIRAFSAVTDEKDHLEIFWQLFNQAVLDPIQGEPHIPKTLRVESQELFQFLKQRLTEGEWQTSLVLVKDTLAGEALVAAYKRISHSVGYMSRDDADIKAVRLFFETAKDWAQLKPWNDIAESEVLLIEGLEEKPIVTIVMGNGSEDKGVALFRTPKDVAEFAKHPDRVRLFFQYTTPYVAGPSVVMEIEEYNLPVHSANEIPVASNPGDGKPFAGVADLYLLVSVMDVVEALVKQNSKKRQKALQQIVRTKNAEEVKVTSLKFLEQIDKPKKLGRNDPCWCGSGKKYKKCHGQNPEGE